ncbi:MAG: hypothetical protein Kow00127_08210 [Bacteroidales bacterium]
MAHCVNINSCRLFTISEFGGNENARKNYIEHYCLDDNQWKNCKRYQVKEKLQFCPDFVLPDTNMSIDEIIDEFDRINTSANGKD